MGLIYWKTFKEEEADRVKQGKAQGGDDLSVNKELASLVVLTAGIKRNKQKEMPHLSSHRITLHSKALSVDHKTLMTSPMTKDGRRCIFPCFWLLGMAGSCCR